MSVSPRNPGARRRDLILLLLAGIGLGSFWAWAVRPDPTTGDYFPYPAHEYYPLMVEGWLQSRLDLPHPVAQGLLDLSDPYDPEASRPYRFGTEGVHDLSLYGDRLYSYWGPTPALVAFLPWRLLTGNGLDTAWSVWSFVMAGWLFASLLLLQVIRRYFPRTGRSVRFLALLVLGLGNFAAVVLQRPSVYEASIAAAYAFAMLAFWQLAGALWRPAAVRAVPLAVASLAFGLAIGARPSWIVAAPVLLAALWDLRGNWRQPLSAKLAASALFPLLACVLLLLLLNWARFDDPFEFGMGYQLNEDPLPDSFFALRHLPFSIGMYLFAAPVTTDYFPFLLPSAVGDLPAGNRGSENVFGLLPLLPVLCAAVSSGAALRVRALNKLVLMLTACFFAILGVLAMHLAVTMRYELDLAPTLALLAAIGMLTLEDRWRDAELTGRLFRALWCAALAVSFGSTFLATCSMSPGRQSPGLERIASWANSAALWGGWSADAVVERLELRLVLPADLSGQREEALVSTGRTGLSNLIYLRRPRPDRLVIGFRGAGGRAFESEPLEVGADIQHSLALELGSFYPPKQHPFWKQFGPGEAQKLRARVRVELDGEVVMEGRARQFPAVDASPVVGDLPLGSGDTHRFTGTLLAEKRHYRSLK